jgi:Kef-type K+ transport system membrane component KefB
MGSPLQPPKMLMTPGKKLRRIFMHADTVPVIVGIMVFAASLVSLKLGISVAIIEILLGTLAGNLGMKPEAWMTYVAGLGGIVLTFLAGTEIDMHLFRSRFKESFLIGFFSFLIPFIGAFLYAFYLAGWTLKASLIAGVALSTTSLAVVYSVLVETGLSKSEIGKLLMAATFITDMGTALALSLLFMKPSVYTLAFIAGSIVLIFLATKFSHIIFHHPGLKNKVIEPEIKYLFMLIFMLVYFANLGDGQAVLPAFVLGLLMSGHFSETTGTHELRNRLRTVAYAVITPLFFIVGGMKVSLSMIWVSFGLFAVLFAVKIIAKFIGVYFLARRYIPNGSMYTTLLMSTGLTFGTISSLFGLNAGILTQPQYSILVGVVVASAVIPTFIAQKWFLPVHSEDLIELGPEDEWGI